jgi:hypothetical protein
LLAIVAFMIGLMFTRPKMMKSMSLAQAAMSASGADRDRMLAEAQALRVQGAKAGKIVTWLLILAAVAMAIARYV